MAVKDDSWRTVVDDLGLWTVIVDSNGVILEVNEAFERGTGRRGSDATGTPLWELALEPDEREAVRANLCDGGEPRGFVCHMSGAREPRIVEWTVVPAVQGRERRLVCAGIDRTERRAALAALSDETTWWRLLLAQIPAILFTTDAELNFTSGVGAPLAELGLRSDQLTGTPLARYFGTDDNPSIASMRRALAGETSTHDLEWLGRAFHTGVAPLRGDGGAIIGTVGLALDITDRKLAEKERDRSLAAERAARERAEAALLARDEFLSIASHELYTPMTSLQLAVQSLSAGDAGGAAADRLLALAERQTTRVIRLIHDLLDVSRIHGGRLALCPRDTDLAAVVREVTARCSSDLERAGCDTTVEADAPVIGYWDGDRLEQVVTNLITNACRYAAGSPVTVRAAREGDRARLTVADRGPGMEPERTERIFERFEGGDAGRPRGGLGLGLYIVRQIARAHGGRAWAESAPGEGVTVHVEVPLAGPGEQPAEEGS